MSSHTKAPTLHSPLQTDDSYIPFENNSRCVKNILHPDRHPLIRYCRLLTPIGDNLTACSLFAFQLSDNTVTDSLFIYDLTRDRHRLDLLLKTAKRSDLSLQQLRSLARDMALSGLL